MTIDIRVYPRSVQHHRLLSLEDLLLVEWLAAERIDQVRQELAYNRRLLEALLRGEGKIIDIEGKIMTAVEAQQEDLDNLGDKFEALVQVVGEIDTTKLPAADLTKLNTALSDVSGAINGKLPVTTPVTDPGTGDTTPPADGGDTGTDTGSGDTSTPPADTDTPPVDTGGDVAPTPVNDVPET